jgi:peptidyl-tRNA hydrolase
MIFVVRMDLKLSLNKMAESVATACLKAYQQIEAASKVDELKSYAFYNWTEGHQKKIVVKAQTEKDLLEVIEKAKAANMNFVAFHELPSKLSPPKPPKPAVKKEKKDKREKKEGEKG